MNAEEPPRHAEEPSRRSALDGLASAEDGVPLLLRKGFVFALVGVFVVVAIAYFVATRWYGVSTELNAKPFREWVDGFGRLGPVVFILVMALSVLIAPIPNVPIFFAAGLAWGAFLGTLYSLIGLTLGSAAAFLVARKLGRRFLPRLIGRRAAERLDNMSITMGGTVIFWSRMIPAINFDWISFLAGMTSISFWRFLVFSALGMIIPTFTAVAAGQGLGDDSRLTLAMGALWVASLVASGAFFWRRRRNSAPAVREPALDQG